jgi:membrane-associated phospholipid phosphatase
MRAPNLFFRAPPPLAATVATARLLRGEHYLSDLMAGAALGIYVGRTLGKLQKQRRAVLPYVEPASKTAGLALAWRW